MIFSGSKRRNAVIFDFDGVLADTAAIAYRVLCRIAERKGVPAPQVDFLRHARSQEIQRALGIRWWEMGFYVGLGRKWLTEERHSARIFPWASELLETAHAHSETVMILSSNSPENIRAILQRDGVARPGLEIHGNIGMFSKARAIRRVVSRYGLPPGKVLYVGDETRDIEAARAAGVRPVGVCWGYHSPELLGSLKPEHLLGAPGEFESVVKSLLL